MLDVQEIFSRRVLLMSQILMVVLSEFLVAPVGYIKFLVQYLGQVFILKRIFPTEMTNLQIELQTTSHMNRIIRQ